MLIVLPLTLNMNNSNDQNIEIEILNKQNIEHEVSNNQNLEPEVLNNQDVELEILAAYNSTDDLSDIDTNNFDDIEEFSVGKVFKNWDQVVDFMKKYAIVKGHGIRIGGIRKINAKTKKIIKWTYLCCYARKPAKSSEVSCQHIGHKLNPLVSQFDLTLRKLPKEIVEEIHF
ncbi:9675_t:CDS:2 [Gigaspora margarita]|uniref:9675_t:CDS:1 n=1 Tax=Gigaspora margarita TaxID=4874 RepID=A0ABN7V025_GIGMA|nr:9675_t:CDS:2 [Gigaspora margarita]